MQKLHYQKRGAHLNKIERFYIHAEHASNKHLNDRYTIFPHQNLWHPPKNLPFITPTHHPPHPSRGQYPIYSKHKTPHPPNETRPSQEINTHTHTIALYALHVTAWTYIIIFMGLFQKWKVIVDNWKLHINALKHRQQHQPMQHFLTLKYYFTWCIRYQNERYLS
jgi:hypothetical protein